MGKISWRREGQPAPVFLPGEFHGQRSLVGYSPWGHKKLDKTERLRLYFHGFSNHFHFASSELDMSGCTSFWNQRFLPCHLVLVPVPHSLDMSQVRSDTFPSKDGYFMPKCICIYPAHGRYQAHILAWFIFCVAVHHPSAYHPGSTDSLLTSTSWGQILITWNLNRCSRINPGPFWLTNTSKIWHATYEHSIHKPSYLYKIMEVKVLVAQSCLTLFKPKNCSLPDFPVHGIFSGKNTRVGSHSLLHWVRLRSR